jgi:hypothetical protein
VAAIPSILTSVKKNLGIADAYEVFDPDIILYINTAFSTLNQLGVGPELGFTIDDKTTTWDAFIGTDKRYENVKTFVTLTVRMLFDPPQTSYLLDAMNKQIDELAWRINVYREETGWVDPDPDVVEDEDLVLDGGGP